MRRNGDTSGDRAAFTEPGLADAVERWAQHHDSDASLVRVSVVAGGTSASMRRLHIPDGHGGGSDAVVRTAGAGDSLRGQGAFEREAWLLGLLARHDVPVPGVIDAGLTWSILEWIDGRPGNELDVASVDPATGATPARVATSYAQVLTAIRNIEVPADIALPDRTARALATIESACRQQHDTTGDIARALGPAPGESRTSRGLVHGDLWPGNALFDIDPRRASTITAVLDWEDAAVGPPEADAAGTLLETLLVHGPATAAELRTRLEASADLDTDSDTWTWWRAASVVRMARAPLTDSVAAPASLLANRLEAEARAVLDEL